MFIDQIARVCHEANRAVQLEQAAPGIPVAPPWDEFPEEERAGVIAGVESALGGATPEQLHDAWCDAKRADGWEWGPVKDTEQRAHPNLVAYAELDADQRAKDALFQAIVHALAPVAPGATSAGERDDDAGRDGHAVVVRGSWSAEDPRQVWLDGEQLRNVVSYDLAEDASVPGLPLLTVSFRTRNITVLPTLLPDSVTA